MYKREINLKSLRWNVPGIDTAPVSVVMCGVGQTHTLTEEESQGLVRKTEAGLCVLDIKSLIQN